MSTFPVSRHIDIAGIAWNHMLALRKRYYRLTGKSINRFAMAKHMAKLRRRSSRFSHLKMLGSQSLQEVGERQWKAYERFFFYKKKGGRKVGLPRFRKVKKYPSFTLKQSGWK